LRGMIKRGMSPHSRMHELLVMALCREGDVAAVEEVVHMYVKVCVFVWFVCIYVN
jgi:hypothetical protein